MRCNLVVLDISCDGVLVERNCMENVGVSFEET